MKVKKGLKSSILTTVIASTVFTNSLPIFASGSPQGYFDETIHKPAITLYVSPTGDDGNNGTEASPFRTLERIQSYIDGFGDVPKGGIEVILREGVYREDIVIKTKATKDSPIVYRAKPNTKVVFDGSSTLSPSDFSPIKDKEILSRLNPNIRDKVLVYDLGAQGIKPDKIYKVGMNWPSPISTALELVVDGEAQTLARWPNNNNFATTGESISNGFTPRRHKSDDAYEQNVCKGNHPPESEWIKEEGPEFRVDISKERGENWLKENDPWFTGYWVWDWAVDNLSAKKGGGPNNDAGITKDDKGYKIKATHPSFYGVEDNKRYFAFNMLSEIDSEGEFYIDRESNLMYLYPKDGTLDGKSVSLKTLNKPFIQIEDARNIKIQNITFANSLTDGIIVNDSENIDIAGCTFKELNRRAITINGGKNCGVRSSTLTRLGQGGIYLTGGDRVMLEDANHYAINNEISDYQRIIRTYTPAVQMVGSGLIASNNLIYDAPHVAIQFSGNNIKIINNEIFNVCYETDDCGAIYAMRDWTKRGNIVDNNYISGIGKGGGHGAAAVYLDDVLSSVDITNNLFIDSGKRVLLLGGGRDNVVKHNILIDSPIGIYLDDRGLNWASKQTYGPNGSIFATFKNIWQKLENNEYAKQKWEETYPQIAGAYIKKDVDGIEHVYDAHGHDFANPEGNTFTENIFVDVDDITQVTKSGFDNIDEDNISLESISDIGFTNYEGKDFTFADKSKILDELPNFRGFDATKVGLFIDTFRPEVGDEVGNFKLIYPLDNAIDMDFVNVKFEWDKAINAKEYIVKISKEKDFSSNIITINTKDTTAIAKTLDADTTYYWKVLAFEGVTNGAINESCTKSFKTKSKEYDILESFEDGFSGWISNDDKKPNTSDKQAYSGEKSFIVDDERIFIQKPFSNEEFGTVFMYLYDDIENTPIATVIGNVAMDNDYISIGINSGIDKNNYSIRVGDKWSATNVKRSTGWHKLSWDYNNGQNIILRIDDKEVVNITSQNGFNQVTLGDMWGKDNMPVSNLLFDDISIHLQKSGVNPTDLVIDTEEVTLLTQEKYTVNAYITPALAIQDIIWTTSDNNIAVARDGTIEGVREGTAIITATSASDKNIYKQIKVVVKNR